MAASNFTPISLYYSSTASAVPIAGNLVDGELAINITDGKLYFKNNAGVVTLLAQAGGGSAATPTVLGTVYGDTDLATPFTTTLGYQAGNVTTGANNTFIGHESGRVTTTGNNNSSVGKDTLRANTTGSSNSAFGSSALASNTTGGNNSAFGNVALFSNTTGASNVAIGDNALLVNSTGNSNTAVGASALNFTSGSNNTAIGNSAGSNLFSGSNNILIGYNAQVSASPISNEATWGNSSITSNRFWGDMKMAGANAGTSGQVLTSAGAGVAPTWTTLTGGVTTFSAGTTGLTPSTATTGAVTLAGTLAAVNGGTGQSTYAVGDILVGGTSNTLNKLADVATGNALISGGVGVAPSYGKIGLTTHVSGTLPIANGGTGQTTANAAYNALSPMTTTGDMEYRNASSVATRLPIGSAGQVLTVSGGIPAWGAAPAGAAANPFTLGTVFGSTLSASPRTTAIGNNAGQATTGQDNAFLGHQAGYTNSSGTRNTAMGKDAFYNASTATDVVAIGMEALRNPTTCSGAVAIGYQALFTNSSTAGSVGIGYRAGNKSPQVLTAVGYEAALNTTAAYCTAIGYTALKANTTGQYNTALGAETLLTGGMSFGTAVGGQALRATTGDNNTALGYYSGGVLTTGTQNTLIGAAAGTSGSGLTTGSNNILIGYNSISSSASVSNENTFGNSSTTSNRFWGDMKMAGANAGTSGQVLTSAGAGVSPTWTTVGAATATPVTLGTVYGKTQSNLQNFITGIGYNAGLSATGVSSTFLGFAAGQSTTTGTDITAVGRDAGYSTTTGAQNTAVGSNSLRTNTTGSDGTAVGFYSLYSSTGGGNTAIGTSSGRSNTTGTNSIFVGYNAGYAGGASTGTNNILIGYNATPSSGTVSNEFTHGNSSITSNRFWGDMKMAGANAGTSGQVLTSAGAGVAPTWTTPGGGAAATATTLGTVYGVTSAATGANVAYGYDAGVGSSAGLYNTVIGNRANRTMPSGTNSQYTAIGFEALNNSSGAAMAGPCTAIGYQAMGAMTQSFPGYGTAVGFEALKNGSYASTAVGHQALALDAGNNNCAFGYLALSASTSSTSNSAFGASSLAALTTASSNSAFGASSLAAVTTGGNNSSFGNGAGSNITTGTNNTVIGYSAQATSATVSNEITLGNSSIATLRCQVTTITALSDARDKKDITPLQAGIEFIKKLNPVNFIWNMRDGGKVDIADAGFIAQELKQAQIDTGITIPNLVFEGNPDRLEAGYGALLPVLVKAIQELNAKVEVLESQLKEKQ